MSYADLQRTAGIPFRTRRLFVQPFRLEDLDSLVAMMVGDSEMSFEHREYGREEVEKLLKDHRLRPFREHGFGVMAARLAPGGELVAQAGLKLLEIEGRQPEVELIAYVARAHWGKGYARELWEAFIDRAFAAGRDVVYAITRPGNTRIERLVAHFGFKADGNQSHFGVEALRWRIDREDYFAWDSSYRQR